MHFLTKRKIVHLQCIKAVFIWLNLAMVLAKSKQVNYVYSVKLLLPFISLSGWIILTKFFSCVMEWTSIEYRGAISCITLGRGRGSGFNQSNQAPYRCHIVKFEFIGWVYIQPRFKVYNTKHWCISDVNWSIQQPKKFMKIFWSWWKGMIFHTCINWIVRTLILTWTDTCSSYALLYKFL